MFVKAIISCYLLEAGVIPEEPPVMSATGAIFGKLTARELVGRS
jgi:hypothetical protein